MYQVLNVIKDIIDSNKVFPLRNMEGGYVIRTRHDVLEMN